MQTGELSIASKILRSVEREKISLEVLQSTRIGRVIRLAANRPEWEARADSPVATEIHRLLAKWKAAVDEFVASIGLQ